MTAKLNTTKYSVVVIGSSAGTLGALDRLLPKLPANFPVPVIVVCHRNAMSGTFLNEHFNSICLMHAKEADNLETLEPGVIYFAPPDYHLLVDDQHAINLSAEPPHHFSRPSIDITFESFAEVFESGTIGIILTGANKDGAMGMKKINELGGYTIVQDPETAEVPIMPQAAIAATNIDRITTVEQIPDILCSLCGIQPRDGL